MSVDLVGPPISLVAFVFGVWLGWRLAKFRAAEIAPRPSGFSRGSWLPLRVLHGAFGGICAGGLLAFFADKIGSLSLGLVAVVVCVLCMGVAWGAMIRAWMGFWLRKGGA